MCALAEGNSIPGASSQRGTGSPHYGGRCHGRGMDHGSLAELSRGTRFSRTARPVSNRRHFLVHLYTLSTDITQKNVRDFLVSRKRQSALPAIFHGKKSNQVY